MKKLLSLILILAMVPVIALADVDVKSMTDQELKDMITVCSDELRIRNTSEPDGILICNEGGFRVYQIGNAYISTTGRLEIPVLIYNDLKIAAMLNVNDVTCNDYNCHGYLYSEMQPESKVKYELDFSTEDVELKSVDDIYSLKFRWYVWSYEDRSYKYESEECTEHRFW